MLDLGMTKSRVVAAIPPKRGGRRPPKPRTTVPKISPEVKLAKRFWAKVNKDGPLPAGRPELGPCWLWTASRHKQGYGMFAVNRVPTGAHRTAYELEVGPIPDGLIIDHQCRVEACVRPSHLRPVTHQQNSENQSKFRKTSSGVRGVTFHKRTGKWQAVCASRGKSYYAGLYSTIDAAAEAVRQKRLEVHTHNDTDRHQIP